MAFEVFLFRLSENCFQKIHEELKHFGTASSRDANDYY